MKNAETFGPAIAMLETSSIARGIEATDAMMKRASVDLLLTTIVPRGKYLVLIGGDVADVEAALRAGRDTAAGTVVDEFFIQNAHPQLPAAILDHTTLAGLVERNRRMVGARARRSAARGG